ncbi:MAG TPA: hypothetical protein VK400_06915 [Pyrinomonadaceae bacterium]|nr:hypothetical protein [Pyrinomonadaceae bacterium]
MSINLTRDSIDGRIKSNNAATILRGGHYWIFKDADNPARCLVKPGAALPFKVEYNAAPACQTNSFPVQELVWQSEPWTMLFDHMKMMDCNFLRIWLTGGTVVAGTGVEPKPLDLTPFVRVKVGTKWKWQVYNAVVNNVWNEEYFRRLSSFAEKAENAGIVLQISLFNYLDLSRRFDGGDFRAWCRSPWNPELSDHPATLPNWAKNHLVNTGGTFSCTDPVNNPAESARQAFFLEPNNKLRTIQQALVRKTVQTLAGRTNIIYEIMNEPRGTHQQSAAFSSVVTSWILGAAGAGRRPLISVNASNLAAGVFDVDYWRDNQATIPNYDKLDAISYHGLTGFKDRALEVCGRNVGVPPVNPGSVKARFDRHHRGHKNKSLIYCTDAARTGLHTFPGASGGEYELQTRDGQIWTNYPNMNSDTPEDQRKKSDLQNWAYWCMSLAVPHAGMVHFQNHSLNQVSYRRIGNALHEAQTSPMSIEADESVEEAAAATAEAAALAPVA